MKRRQFLKSMLFAGVGANTYLSGNPLSMVVNKAQAAQGKTLIVIFQRGGCDGLNTIVPYSDPNYYNLRPNIAIAAPDVNNSDSALDLNGEFGLHPALAPLLDIYQTGNMAVFPAVHYPEGSRSHFRSQHLIESAQVSELESDGWLNRHLQTQSFNASIRAASIGSEVAQSLRGEVTTSSFQDIDNFSLQINNDEQVNLLNTLKPVYHQAQGSASAHALLQRFALKTFTDLDAIQTVADQPLVIENGAQYPSTSFGRDLQQISRLVKAGIGLELATVDIGGWDHHSNQGGGESNGSQARSHKNFAEGIAALVKDLGDKMQDVVILTSTEFGRTAAENGSLGTDHGYASSWLVIGDSVQGGVKGNWPGLAPEQLQQGRFLAMDTDYRDIYAQILEHHLLNQNFSELIPGFNATDLGLFT